VTGARIDLRENGGGHARPVRLMLLVGFSLGILAPTLHHFTLAGAGGALGMGDGVRVLSLVLVVCASLAGLFTAGRAVDVYGTRAVVLGSLVGSCVGGTVIVSAPNAWAYGAGLVVQSASVMGAVAGMWPAPGPLRQRCSRRCCGPCPPVPEI
jgi:MFS family permease